MIPRIFRGQFEKKKRDPKEVTTFIFNDLAILISGIYFKEIIRDKHKFVYKDVVLSSETLEIT